MALRLCTEILHGELENRHPGRTTGILHLVGHKEPVTLDLVGNPWRDLAGHRVVFKNPSPGPAREATSRLVKKQTGRVGDITASRKVKVLDCPLEELSALHRENRPTGQIPSTSNGSATPTDASLSRPLDLKFPSTPSLLGP